MKYLSSTLWCIALLILFSGCVFYQRYPMAKSRLTKIDNRNLTYYLLDASRPMSRVWHISEADFQDDKMIGFFIRVSEMEAEEIATVYSKRDAKDSKNDVLMYAKPKFAIALPDTATMTVTYDQLEKIEVYEVNHGKSVAISLLVAFMPMTFLAALSDY